MKKYLYISGPITGNKDYLSIFKAAEKWINNNTDYIPINPSVLNQNFLKRKGIKKPTWNDYMKASFYHLTFKPNISITFLRGWKKSKGCVEERIFGIRFNYDLITFEDLKK